jgi:hypothetical protein
MNRSKNASKTPPTIAPHHFYILNDPTRQSSHRNVLITQQILHQTIPCQFTLIRLILERTSLIIILNLNAFGLLLTLFLITKHSFILSQWNTALSAFRSLLSQVIDDLAKTDMDLVERIAASGVGNELVFDRERNFLIGLTDQGLRRGWGDVEFG